MSYDEIGAIYRAQHDADQQRIRELEAENERLKKALEEIAAGHFEDETTVKHDARAALTSPDEGGAQVIKTESLEDEMRGVVTYELSDGSRIKFAAASAKEIGAAEMIRRCGYGHLLSTARVPVLQDGRRIGTLPPDFDPENIKSRSFLYDPRPGDFRREGSVWIADKALGSGDLDAIPGFIRDGSPDEEG